MIKANYNYSIISVHFSPQEAFSYDYIVILKIILNCNLLLVNERDVIKNIVSLGVLYIFAKLNSTLVINARETYYIHNMLL